MNRLDVVAYVPSIHQGYLNFFERNQGHLNILGPGLLAEEPRLERDIRAIAPERVVLALGSLGVADSVQVLDHDNLDEFCEQAEKVVMPEEDISHRVADTYFAELDVRFESTFLRWDWGESTLRSIPVPDVIISNEEVHRRLMSLADSEGQRSPDWWRQVGGVLVQAGTVVATAHNEQYPPSDYNLNTFGDPRSNFEAGERIELSKVLHTEARMIADLASAGRSTKDTELYVTTFPCPNCARLIAASGIAKVYYRDGYSLLDAQDVLKTSGVEVVRVVDWQGPKSASE